MASTTTKIVAAIVVIIVIIAAVAVAWWAVSDDDDDDKYTYLVEDQDGVYFWISGHGDDAMDALVDATDKFGIDMEYSVSEYGASLESLFGMGMIEIDENWTYWNQFVWDGNEWIYSDYCLNEVDRDYAHHGYIALVYGGIVDPQDIPVTPDDKKVWDRSTSGTVFTIRSETGLWFQINGKGDTVLDAFAAAVEKYNIPAELTDTGVNSLFGLGMVLNDSNNWVYWVQYQVIDGEEVESGSYMSHLDSSDNPQFVLSYEEYIFY